MSAHFFVSPKGDRSRFQAFNCVNSLFLYYYFLDKDTLYHYRRARCDRFFNLLDRVKVARISLQKQTNMDTRTAFWFHLNSFHIVKKLCFFASTSYLLTACPQNMGWTLWCPLQISELRTNWSYRNMRNDHGHLRPLYVVVSNVLKLHAGHRKSLLRLTNSFLLITWCNRIKDKVSLRRMKVLVVQLKTTFCSNAKRWLWYRSHKNPVCYPVGHQIKKNFNCNNVIFGLKPTQISHVCNLLTEVRNYQTNCPPHCPPNWGQVTILAQWKLLFPFLNVFCSLQLSPALPAKFLQHFGFKYRKAQCYRPIHRKSQFKSIRRAKTENL